MFIPRMFPVESSSVKAIGYIEDGTLYVQYMNNSIYCYKDVPAEVFIKLINATSIGSFIAREIKPVYLDYDYLR